MKLFMMKNLNQIIEKNIKFLENNIGLEVKAIHDKKIISNRIYNKKINGFKDQLRKINQIKKQFL